jgi:PAS domain-containing protein
MSDMDKTQADLVEELAALRARVALLENIESKHRRAERDLYESEARFRRLFENMPDGYLLANWEGQILMVNAAAAAFLRYEKAELLSKKHGPRCCMSTLKIASA